MELIAQGFLECFGHAMCIITMSRQWLSRLARENALRVIEMRRKRLTITIASEPYNTMMKGSAEARCDRCNARVTPKLLFIGPNETRRRCLAVDPQKGRLCRLNAV